MSRHNIVHETIIEAPIESVWKEVINIDDWEWNRWTKLKCAKGPIEGNKGKLLACYEGNDENWQEFDFEFGPVNESQHLLTWLGNVGPGGCLFSGYHTIELEIINKDQTKLIHQEKFGGLLPLLGLGLPYTTLDRNYRRMNESLKATVEKKKLAMK